MRVLRLAAMVIALAGIALVGLPFVHGLSFVVRATDMTGGAARRLADWDAGALRERIVTIPTKGGSMRARAYEPAAHPRRAVLLVSGLHSSGIDEPRLVNLARQLSSAGLVVVTPDIPALSQFDVTPDITGLIERSSVWLAAESGLAPDHKIGLMGISFSGGLSLVAAGRPSLANQVAYVAALGGHDDLPRVLRYLCTGEEPYPPGQVRFDDAAGNRPFTRPPHASGVAVILLGVADLVVPPPQVDALRAAVRKYLWASALDGGADKSGAQAAFDGVRAALAGLREPSKTLMQYVINRDVVHLGARLLPYVNARGGNPALSLSKSPKPTAPVFLLHGVEDDVIPSIESEYIANDLRGRAPVRLLLSELVAQAEADRPGRVVDVLRLAGFWGVVLGK